MASLRNLWVGVGFCLVLALQSYQYLHPRCGCGSDVGLPHMGRKGLLEERVAALESGMMYAGGDAGEQRVTPLPLRTPRDLDELSRLLARPAGLHGRLNKAGLPAVIASGKGLKLNSHRDTLPETEWPPTMRAWISAARSYDVSRGISTVFSDPAEAGRFRSPSPSCTYFFDPVYRVFYARSTKTAGTSVSKMFGFQLGPNECKENPADCLKPCEGKPMCLQRTMNETRLRDFWDSYTVFGVARNPWARAVSSWAYVNKLYLKDTSCIGPFSQFAANPGVYTEKCMGDPQARWLMALNHIEPQEECTFTMDGRPAVDFLARTEQLEEDMLELGRLINERRPEGVPPLPELRPPLNNLNVDAATNGTVEARVRQYAVQYVNGTALDDIAMYFANDLQWMKYV